jgi:hypothetical protein
LKTCGALKVMSDFTQKESTVIIHPNDGFDLGLMTVSYDVDIYYNISEEDLAAGKGTPLSGKIELKNECTNGTAILSMKSVEKMGKPKNVFLCYDSGKLLIRPDGN